MTGSADVVVVGGGVIGLTAAWELASAGARVRLLERGELGREASWAGAGILPPGVPGDPTDPYAALCAATHRLWPALAEQLTELTGIDGGFRKCGGIRFCRQADLQQELDDWKAANIEALPLDESALGDIEPAVRMPEAAYLLPDTCQVRNPRHLKALAAACYQSGVQIHEGAHVIGVERGEPRITAVRTSDRRYEATHFVFAGGAWSSQLSELDQAGVHVRPIRGQIVLLRMQPVPHRSVLEEGSRYLVPRSDGRVLIGSTEEDVGFVNANTAEAVEGLLQLGRRLVPSLADAKVERCWSGLRPYAERPLIGRLPGADNAVIATGHFRSGLHLSPITGRIVRRLILGEQPDVPVDVFAVKR